MDEWARLLDFVASWGVVLAITAAGLGLNAAAARPGAPGFSATLATAQTDPAPQPLRGRL